MKSRAKGRRKPKDVGSQNGLRRAIEPYSTTTKKYPSWYGSFRPPLRPLLIVSRVCCPIHRPLDQFHEHWNLLPIPQSQLPNRSRHPRICTSKSRIPESATSNCQEMKQALVLMLMVPFLLPPGFERPSNRSGGQESANQLPSKPLPRQCQFRRF